jgi:hypothetical protein
VSPLPFIGDIAKRERISLHVAIVSSIELGTPYLDDMRKTLQQDLLDPCVKISNPVLEISISFKIQAVNLCKGTGS